MRNLFCIFFASLFFMNCSSQEEIKSITTLELKKLLAKEKIQLLDVRTPKEVEQGFIKSALFVNYFDDNFYTEATKQLEKDTPVYLYCRSGNRSEKASKILQEKGYNVYNILGGYTKWKREI